jgi:large subunit ribosomal protein L14
MIQTQTILKVADNTGAKTVKCIGFVNKQREQHANIGDCIIVSVRSLTRMQRDNVTPGKTSIRGSSSSMKKGQIYKALIIRTKRGTGTIDRRYGHRIIFDNNSVVLLNNKNELLGSRIFGPVTRELRANNFRDLLSYADKIY